MHRLKDIVIGGLTQLRKQWKLLLLLYTPIALLFVVIAVISRLTPDLEMADFTRDVTAVADIPFYMGSVSQLGVVLWAATATVCLFAAFVLRYQNRNPSAQRFLFQAGILTTYLLLDDVYLIHESVFTEYLHIPQRYIFLGYFVWVLSFLFLNRQEILTTEYSLLGLAFLLFGVSLFFDVAHLYKNPMFGFLIPRRISTILEDMPKFAGIATWLLYYTRYALLNQMLVSAGFGQVKQKAQSGDKGFQPDYE